MADNQKLREALKRLVGAPENNLQIVHGFVAKHHAGENGGSGTIDFVSMDGTIRIPSISLSTIPGLKRGAIVTPTLQSDVTVLWSVGSGDASILSLSHVESYANIATQQMTLGVTGERRDEEKDYNEQEEDGHATATVYTQGKITSTATNPEGEASLTLSPEGITLEKEGVKTELGKEGVKHSAGGSYAAVTESGVTLEGQQINLGEGAQEPALLGEKTALLLTDFITACSQITVPTMLGTMPIVNIPQFAALLPRCQEIKSLIVKVK